MLSKRYESTEVDQIRESTEWYSRWKVEKDIASSRNLVSTIGAQASPKKGGRNQVFGMVSVPCWLATPVESWYQIKFHFVMVDLLLICPSSVWTYYGIVMSVRVVVRQSQFSALISYMLWYIELNLCAWHYYNARMIKFQCLHFPSIFAGVMPLYISKLLKIFSFPHFSPTLIGILSLNFVYDFVIMQVRSRLNVVTFRQFL